MKTAISDIIGATSLQPDEKNALEDHARYLLSTLPANYTKMFVDPALPGKKIPVTVLRRIVDELKRSQQLDEHPVPSMLAAVAGNSTKTRKHHEKLKAWVFLAALALADRKSTVGPACRRIRRLAEPEDRWLLKDILRIDGGLKEIVSELDELRDWYSGRTVADTKTANPTAAGEDQDSTPASPTKMNPEPDSSKQRKVAAIHVLLADLLYERQKRGPGPGGKRSGPLPNFVERLVQTPADGFLFTDVDGIEIVSDEQEVSGCGPGAESQSAGNRYLDTIADNAYPTLLKRRVKQGRELARVFSMRATASACAWEGLSENEVQRALSLCYEAADSGCRASLWIVLSILLGRTPERLWSTPRQIYGQSGQHGEFWRVTKKQIQLVSYLTMPAYGLDFDDQQLVERTYNCLLLPVPTDLTEPLRDALTLIWNGKISTNELREELKTRSRYLNAEHNTRLTPNRLAAHLHRSVVQSGDCDVVSKRIRGIAPRSNYKQRYESCNQEFTQDVYRRYAKGILRVVDRESSWQDSQYKAEPLGTQLKIKDDAIRYLFEYLRQETAARHNQLGGVVEHHNAYVMYVYQLLMLASGHRPVRVPLDTVTSYDRVSGEYFICDKAAQRANDSRTVVLPEVACDQIEFYLTHLDVLERRCRRLAPENCETIRRARNGSAALLFRLEPASGSSLTVTPFDPRDVNRWLGDEWTLPLNWHRHWLRSTLTRLKQPHEYIDLFMGHENDQPPGLGRFSNLTYAGRKALAACVDSMLSDVGVTAMGGLQ